MTEKTFNLLDYRPEDGGILDAWLYLYGDDWLYVAGFERWFKFSGKHWQKDDCQELQAQIQTLLDRMNRAAIAELQSIEGDDGKAKAQRAKLREYVNATKRSRNRIASIEAMAQAHRAVAPARLDASNTLNLSNGTLDLETITLRPHSRDDFLTSLLPYDYDPRATAPLFEKFLTEVLVKEENTAEADLELCALVQESMGYSLTNDMSQQVMFWLSGMGSNGKSVLIKTLQKLVGDKAMALNFALLGTTDGNYRIAELIGKRMAFCTESPRDGSTSEELMRQLADGSIIDARPIRGTPVQFESTVKIWWAMNDRPRIKDTTYAFWRRLKLIPFHRVFRESEKDIHLENKLKAELPGILNFALDGLVELRKNGTFTKSIAMADAIKEYQTESNPVAQWREECTEDGEAWTAPDTLYFSYTAWCARAGRQPYNTTNFGKEVKRLGVANKRTKSGIVYALTIK